MEHIFDLSDRYSSILEELCKGTHLVANALSFFPCDLACCLVIKIHKLNLKFSGKVDCFEFIELRINLVHILLLLPLRVWIDQLKLCCSILHFLMPLFQIALNAVYNLDMIVVRRIVQGTIFLDSRYISDQINQKLSDC